MWTLGLGDYERNHIKITCDATCFQMNIFFLFLEGCCKMKRPLSIMKLKCCTHNTAVTKRTIPNMLRLSLWDVFDSSLNPPTRWSSSLQRERKGEKKKRHLNWIPKLSHINFYSVCLSVCFIPALLTDVTQRCDSFYKERDFRPGARAVTVSKANSSTTWHIIKLNHDKHIPTSDTGRNRHKA